MAEKFKKINKTFVLSDSSLNSYGFRLLTTGYQADKYQRNPIGYYMHQRDGGVLLRWDNIRIEGDQILAEPVINLSHPRGQQTVDEIESGFLNAASFGRIIVLDASNDPALMLEGQTGPTVTKWFNKECSLCDIPGNDNALAELFDQEDKPINLADFSSNNNFSMKKVELLISADLIKSLNLSDNPDAASVQKGISDLALKAARADQLEIERTNLSSQITQLTTEKGELEKKVNDLQSEATTKEVRAILDAALADGKVTKEAADKLETSFKDNPAALKDLVSTFKPFPSVTGQIDDASKNKQKADVSNLSWDELDKMPGKLADLKANNWPMYEQKFEERFGKKPTK